MPERILIVRLSAVGDTILNLPVLCALRRHLPDAEIGWVVGRGASQILRGHDCLDRLFVLNPEDQKSPGAYLRFARSLRAWGPKVVLDAQGLTKSAGLGWLAGAKTRIGLARSEFEGRELSTWLNTHVVAPQSEHVVDRGLELLRPLGIENPEIEFCVPDSSEHTAAVRESTRALGLPSRWALLNVGAGWVSKLWPADRYAEVARHLADKWDLESVVLWGNAE